MMNFTVNDSLCTRCGLCVLDCPSRIIEQPEMDLPQIADDGEAKCIQCQHCMAVCPTAAISIFGRDPADSISISADKLPSCDQMATLIRSRRSIRHYKDSNVDPDLIAKLLATVSNAPSGVNSRKLTFNVIDDKDVMHQLRDKVLSRLKAENDAGKIPDTFAYLTAAVPAYYDHGADILFRNAPHALIISEPPDAPCPSEDVTLALAYFELLAQSAGLGTVWWGMLKMVLIALPEMKTLLGLPEKHTYYGMLFGTPDIKYPRTVQRDDAAKIRRITC
jgi:nitroreductase/NAD-dependent dihydropyrimidine dehydrogenase PreA subunit